MRSSSAGRVGGDWPEISSIVFGAKMGSSVGVKNHQDKNPTNGRVFYLGAPEDRCLEPLESISDWLLSSPDIDWILQLRNASLSGFVSQYQL